MKEMYLKVKVKDIKDCDSIDVFFREDRYFICPKDDKNLVEIEDVEKRREPPKIIYCKDCKYNGRKYPTRFIRGYDCLMERIATIVPDRDFCSRAERRTDG